MSSRVTSSPARRPIARLLGATTRGVGPASLALVVAGLLAGCGSSEEAAEPPVVNTSTTEISAPAPTTTAAPESTTTTTVPITPSIQFNSAEVITYDAPDGFADWNLANPGPFEGDLTLQTTGNADGEWIEVVIPTKPNGTTSWIRRADTTPVDVTTNIVVDLSDRTVTLYDNGVEIKQVSAGIGKPATPTPTLHAIVDHVAENENPNGTYGAWTLGLNQHSEALETFAGGRPAIALHGTTNPADIGNEVSNGCIRIENSVLVELAPLIPLGTPVEIKA